MPDALELTTATTQPPPRQHRSARRVHPKAAEIVVITPPERQRAQPPDDAAAASELRSVTVIAFGVARKILALEPEPGTKDYAKIIGTQGAVALGILNLKARIDTAALRDHRDDDTLGQILRRIHEHDAAAAVKRAPAVVIEQPPAAAP